ncbi:MAG: S-layer homology domain-containing protein [Eubacteriales bacterium]|nr:S-layer homology domain-containing protein [Eubacteriales bacterium]
MTKKRIISIILTLILTMSVCPVMAEAEPYATRLYTIEQFIYAVGTNNLDAADSSVDFPDWNTIEPQSREVVKIALKNKIINGYEDGSVRPNDKVLRIEAFVMLGRALKQLPKVNEAVTFADTPNWAESEVNRLSSAGLIKGIGDGLLGAQDYITQQQVLLLTDRIDAIYNTTDKKDDFYAAVNSKWIRNSNLKPGYFSWSTLSEIDEKTNAIIEGIITDYSTEKTDIAKKNAYNYYLSALDMEKRNSDGAAPIMPYIKMLNAARTTKEIMEVMGNIARDNYMFSLIPIDISADQLNTNQALMSIYGADTGMNAYYLIEDPKCLQAYREYLITLFRLAGEDESNLEGRVDNVIGFQATLASAALTYYEYMEFENRYNQYTPETFKDKYPNIDLEHYLSIMNIQIPNTFIVEEESQLSIINSYITNATTTLLKDYIKACLLKDSSIFLSQGFVDSTKEFNQAFLETEGTFTDQQEAIKLTDAMFGMLVGNDYLKRCYQDSTTQEISDITYDLIDTYKEKIQKLPWLSQQTKEEAIKKLTYMRVKIGGPANVPQCYSEFKILPPKEGGTLFYNTAKISNAMFKDTIGQLERRIDKDEWFISPHTVNAFYSPTSNEIVLPAGILQEPLYSPSYSYEENMGAIGAIIAHELSHAFDSSGALYDEKGNYQRWWTDSDFKTFEALSRKVADRYSQIEVMDGYFVNGDYTLNENIADLGAMSCILETASKQESFDYKKLFESYARSWAEVIPDNNLITTLIVDEHAPAKVRVNGVLQNFDEFYRTYNITDSDKMYLAPKKRVSIW